MNNWDGKERRHNSREGQDHDLLTKIDANLSNFMRRFDDHVSEDNKNFERHELHMRKLDEGQADTNKYIWTAMGVVVAVAFVIKLVWR